MSLDTVPAAFFIPWSSEPEADCPCQWELNLPATVAWVAYRFCNSALWYTHAKKTCRKDETLFPLLTSSHFINLLPFLRLSGTDTGLSCSAWTPGCAPAIDSSTLLDARQGLKLVSLLSSSLISLPLLCNLLESRLTEAHYCCQYVMPTLTATVARLGFGELWRRTQAQRTVATDCLTERHAANAKSRRKDRERRRIWMSCTSGFKLYKSVQGQDLCMKWSSAPVRSRQYDGHKALSWWVSLLCTCVFRGLYETQTYCQFWSLLSQQTIVSASVGLCGPQPPRTALYVAPEEMLRF